MSTASPNRGAGLSSPHGEAMRLSAQEPVQEAAERRWLRQAAEGDRRALEPRIVRQQRRGAEVHACLLALLLAGCKHVSELQVQQHQEAASAATTETHETKSEGPEHIVMTVEEYQQLCGGGSDAQSAAVDASPADGLHERRLGKPGDAGVVAGPPILIRRVTTVTDRGPSLDDLRSLSSLQSRVNTALQLHEVKKFEPAGLLGLLGASWPLILIGGAILAGFVAFKLKPPWLGFLFKLLGRAP